MIINRHVALLEVLRIRHHLLFVWEELQFFANNTLIYDLLLILLSFESRGQRFLIRDVLRFLVCLLAAITSLILRNFLIDASHAFFDAHEHKLDLLGVPLIRGRMLGVVGDKQTMLLKLCIFR